MDDHKEKSMRKVCYFFGVRRDSISVRLRPVLLRRNFLGVGGRLHQRSCWFYKKSIEFRRLTTGYINKYRRGKQDSHQNIE